jgi:hypothetical protein
MGPGVRRDDVQNVRGDDPESDSRLARFTSKA